MIVVKNNLIIARNMAMTPSKARASVENGKLCISVSGNLEVCDAFDSLCRQTIKAFRQDPMTVQEAKKIYDTYYKLWMEFRRKYRHEVFVISKIRSLLAVVEVDNLYLNKKSINTGQMRWSYGVTQLNLDHLAEWSLVHVPPEWNVTTWDSLYTLPNNSQG